MSHPLSSSLYREDPRSTSRRGHLELNESNDNRNGCCGGYVVKVTNCLAKASKLYAASIISDWPLFIKSSAVKCNSQNRVVAPQGNRIHGVIALVAVSASFSQPSSPIHLTQVYLCLAILIEPDLVLRQLNLPHYITCLSFTVDFGGRWWSCVRHLTKN